MKTKIIFGILGIVLIIVSAVIFFNSNQYTIVSEKTDFVYKVYVDTATYTQTPDFTYGDSFILDFTYNATLGEETDFYIDSLIFEYKLK